jgi:thiol-disulfide isomerase/thioredoxin
VYVPSKAAQEHLRQWAPALFVKVYAGSWCSDTKKLLPDFMRLAELTGISYSLYFLDMSKKSPAGEEKKDSILFLPTFILYKDGEELGRVIETAPHGIERHLEKLLPKR